MISVIHLLVDIVGTVVLASLFALFVLLPLVAMVKVLMEDYRIRNES